MKNSKSLIGLVIVVALVVGMAYLFLQVSGAQQDDTKKENLPSTAATLSGTRPSVVTAPVEPVDKTIPIVAAAPAISKEPVHVESDVPLYTGPTLATGDDCTDPIVVSLPGSLPYSDLSQTTCGRMNDYEDPAQASCLYYYDTGEDIIYELDVSSAVDVDITMNPNGTTWSGIALDYECPPDADCIAYVRNSGSSPRVMSGIHLEPGTYYIMIDTWSSPDCIEDFDLTISEAAPPPPNDNCEDAEAVGDVTDLAFSTTTASFDGGGTCMTSPNIWYCYTATCTGDVTVSLCGSSYDTKLAVYESCECDPLGTEIDCNDDACGVQSEITFAGVEGNQYLIEVGGYSSYTGDGILNISCVGADQGACCNDLAPYDCQLLTESECNALSDHTFLGAGTDCGPPNPCPAPPPPNDECTGAPIINTFPTTVSGTTQGATIDCPGVLDWDAVWYQFDLPYTSNNVFVDFCPTEGDIDTVGVVLYDECPPDCPNYILRTGYQWVTCTNGFYNPQIWWDALPGPASYWFPVKVAPGKGAMDFSFEVSVTEGPAAPPNDDCADAEAIGDVINLAFSTSAATFDGSGGCQTAPNIWYCYTATCDGMAHIALCGSGYDTKLGVYEGCECDPVGTLLGCNDDACGGNLQSELTIPVVAGNEYLIEVGGYSSNTGDGVLTCSCYVGGEAPENDLCENAIVLDPPVCPAVQTVYGTTIDATNDCPGVFDWPGVWYTFELPYASNNLHVDYCPTNDPNVGVRSIALLDACDNCAGWIAASSYSWVTCPSGYTDLQLSWNNLPPGTYWLPVLAWDYDYNNMDFAFDICVEEAVPCVLECPPNGIPEGEPDCYDGYVDMYNGGCNSSPYIWQSIMCGDTICGTSGVYDANYYRDTDWFRVEVGDGDLTWTCVAEFPQLIWVIDAGSENCSDYTILDYTYTYDVCDTLTLSMWVPAGVYWVLVMPVDWGNYPCGDQSEYVAWLDCTPFGPQMAVNPASMYPALNPSGDCSTATEELIISSVGGEDLTYSIVENPPVGWMELSSYSGTIPPGNSHTLDVSFDAGGMAPGDYYCDLEIDHNDPGLPDPFVVPVHLTVELAPEIEIAPRLWMPVIPGCMMDQGFRVNNIGEGELRFEVSVTQNPPPPEGGKGSIREALEALQKAGKANPTLTPKEAHKTIGAKRSTVEYHNTGVSEGLLLSAGGGKQANILLVDDDGGLPGGSYYDIEDIYMDALDANGFVYDYYVVDWTDPESPGPDLATMQNYGCVIWFTGETWGYYGDDTFTPTDEDNVGAYLDGGGNLFLSAQDYLWDMYPSAGSFSSGQFPYDYLGLQSVVQDVINDPYTAVGLAGSVAEGMQFDCLRFTDNPDVPLWTDDLTGLAAVVHVFDAYGYISAVQYDAGTFKTVFTTTEVAGLVDASPSTRAEFMASILTWFGCVGPACPFTVYPEEGDVPAESFFDVTLTFDGNLFTECVDETLSCYLVFTSNDCDEPVLTVPVHAMSARGDVNENCTIDISDLVFLVNYVFGIGSAPDPLCIGDLNRDTNVDSDDAVYLASWLWEYGGPPEIPTAPKRIEQTPIQRK